MNQDQKDAILAVFLSAQNNFVEGTGIPCIHIDIWTGGKPIFVAEAFPVESMKGNPSILHYLN